MPLFELEHDGKTFEVDAPDMDSAVSGFKKFSSSKQDIGMPAAIASGVEQGASLNLAEEARGAIAASPFKGQAKWGSGLMGPVADIAAGAARIGAEKLAPSVFGQGGSQAYDQTVAEERAKIKQAQEQYPTTTTAAGIGGAIVGGGPAAALVKGPTLAARALKSAGVGAGLGAAAGAGEGEDIDQRAYKAAVGGAIGAGAGAAGEGLATTLGALWRGIFGARRVAAPGVNPAERAAAADEFGIQLTRGQATGNLKQQAFEEAARNNARGDPAGRITQAFDAKQAAAIDAAKSGLIGGERVSGPEAGEALQAAVRNRAAELKAAGSEAYERAAGKEANIAADEVSRLGKTVAERLEAGGVQLDTYGNYTGSQAAMNLLKRVSGFEGAPKDGQVVAQSLRGLEQARKGLLGIKAANPEDGRALGYIRRAYDDWMDDAVDRKLFSGDASAIDDLKQARRFWSQYKGLTKAKPGDDASSIIVKMQKDGITGEEVANWLTGTAGAGQAGRSARVADELKGIIGTGTPEWEALRQAAWVKASNPTRGEGPQAVAKSIKDFVAGQGAPLARQLYSADELSKMARLSDVLSKLATDRRATNRGQSGYEVARALGIGGGAVGAGGIATAFSGDPKYMAIAALPLLKTGQSLTKGLAATRALPGQVGQGVGLAGRVPALTVPGAAQDQY